MNNNNIVEYMIHGTRMLYRSLASVSFVRNNVIIIIITNPTHEI